ncbi:MAG: hypothetical protein ACK45Z_01340 [Dolichospermum sp.]
MRREQGTGYREQGTGNREQGTGNREQGTGNREQGTGYREQVIGNTSTSSVHRREQGTLRQAQCIAGNREQVLGNFTFLYLCRFFSVHLLKYFF